MCSVTRSQPGSGTATRSSRSTSGCGRRDELANAHRGAGQLVTHLLGDAGVDEQRGHARRAARRRRVPYRAGMSAASAGWSAIQAPEASRSRPGEPVVIGVDVGDEDRPHVRRGVSGDRHAGDQRAPRLIGAPAGVDDREAVARARAGRRARSAAGCSAAARAPTRGPGARARRRAAPVTPTSAAARSR